MCMCNESYKVVHDMLGEAICSCDSDKCLSARAHSMLQAVQGVPMLLALEWGCIHILHHSVGAHAYYTYPALWNPRVILAEKVMALVS